jgi:NTE family protein
MPSSVPTRALVLGGGGLAGIAWELGVLLSLVEAGVDFTAADVVIGTSAGSVVGSVIRSEDELKVAYEAQLSDEPDAEIGAQLDLMALANAFGSALSGAANREEARARIATIALTASTVPPSVRLGVIAARLPSHDWPDYSLRITVTEAPSGKFEVLDRDSGVPLVTAVAASCAVPVVWPPVEIDGKQYIDGGLRSTTNADLAAGNDRVIVIAPFPPVASPLGPALDEELEPVRRTGEALVIAPDEAATQIFGMNPLDPSTRRPSALAGRDHGRTVVDRVRAVWM